MSKRKLARKKLSAESANTETYLATMRESYGDEVADLLSDVYEVAERGKYYIRKNEYPSPEAVRILEELGYSVENKFCESEKKVYCQIGWKKPKEKESRWMNWYYRILVPACTGLTIGITLSMIVKAIERFVS